MERFLKLFHPLRGRNSHPVYVFIHQTLAYAHSFRNLRSINPWETSKYSGYLIVVIGLAADKKTRHVNIGIETFPTNVLSLSAQEKPQADG